MKRSPFEKLNTEQMRRDEPFLDRYFWHIIVAAFLTMCVIFVWGTS